MSDLLSIVGVDPGEATGLFALWVDEGGNYERKIVDYGVAYTREEVFTFLDNWVVDGTTVVVEQFVREEGTHGVNDTAKTVIGWVEAWLDMHGYKPPAFQQRTMKGFVTDTKLKALDLWIKGHEQRHARDAARHAITYAVHVEKFMPIIERGWPRPQEVD